MRSAITQDLFSISATSLGAITREWKQRQQLKVPDLTLVADVFADVETIAAIVLADQFDEIALPRVAGEAHRRLLSSYVGQATCGVLSLRVCHALNACFQRAPPDIPDRAVLTEQVRRLRMASSHYERPKNSSRI